MIPVFRGSVDDRGKVHLLNCDAFDKYAETLKGKPVVLTLKQWRQTRSNPQNAYFHGVVLPLITDASGHTAAEVKDALKFKFLASYAPDGFPIVKRTRDWIPRNSVNSSTPAGCSRWTTTASISPNPTEQFNLNTPTRTQNDYEEM